MGKRPLFSPNYQDGILKSLGHRDVSEKSSKVNTDIGESKEGDGGDEINLKYVF